VEITKMNICGQCTSISDYSNTTTIQVGSYFVQDRKDLSGNVIKLSKWSTRRCDAYRCE
jgi:hypothetical protein